MFDVLSVSAPRFVFVNSGFRFQVFFLITNFQLLLPPLFPYYATKGTTLWDCNHAADQVETCFFFSHFLSP